MIKAMSMDIGKFLAKLDTDKKFRDAAREDLRKRLLKGSPPIKL